MDRHYIIYRGGGEERDHTILYFTRAANLEMALRLYVQETSHDGVTIRDNGSVAESYDRTNLEYPHARAYLEAHEKRYVEWQIRELPDWIWDVRLIETYCGEQSWTIEQYIEQCRPLLRREFPRSRAKGFVWYTYNGPLVTFYTGRSDRDFRVLRRYLIAQDKHYKPNPWEGTHQDLLEQLWVKLWRDERPNSGIFV